MKGNGIERDTLDGVITALEKVQDTWQNARNGLQYADFRDALHYLKEYRTNQEDPDGDHQQLEKAQKLLWEFYQNEPLTWEELRDMEGKPIWVEMDLFRPRWYIIESVNDEKMICIGAYSERVPLYRNDDGDSWQAYRKERE